MRIEKSEFQKNRNLLKRTKIIDYTICLFYVSMIITFIIFSLLVIFGYPCLESLIIFLDGVIVKGAICIAGYFSAYRKKIILSVVASISSFFSGLILEGINSVLEKAMPVFYLHYSIMTTFGLFFVSALLTILNIFNIKDYSYLEQQPGFPYFNDLIENQRFDKIQRNIKTEYQLYYEKKLKTASGKMDIISDETSTDTGREDNPQSGEMNDVFS